MKSSTSVPAKGAERLSAVAVLVAALAGACAPRSAEVGTDARERDAAAVPEVHQAIAPLREEWYEAYYDGDVNVLDRLETDDFVVIPPAGLPETTQRCYADIAERARTGQWFPSGTTRGPEQAEYRLLGDDAAVVYGRVGRAEQGGVTAFTEVWVRRQGQWRVAHLHFHTGR